MKCRYCKVLLHTVTEQGAGRCSECADMMEVLDEKQQTLVEMIREMLDARRS